MAIERTVGTGVGADYENWWNAHEFLRSGLLASDYDFIQVADVTMLNGQDWTLGTYRPDGHTMRFICPWADSPQGDPTKGFLTTFNVGANSIRIQFNGGFGANLHGTFIIDGLYCVLGNGRAFGFQQPDYRNLQLIIARNILIDGQGNNNTGGFHFSKYDTNFTISNTKIWDCTGPGIGAGGAGSPGNVPIPVFYKRVENTVVYNCGTTILGADYNKFGIYMGDSWNKYASFKNVVSVRDAGVTGEDWFMESFDGSAPEYQLTKNCASTDLTLADINNNIRNIIPAEEFQSLDDTNSDFLKLIRGEAEMVITATPRRGRAPLPVKFTANVEYRPEGNILGQSGTAPEFAGNTDIAGEARPGDSGKFAMGAHEQQYDWIVPPLEG